MLILCTLSAGKHARMIVRLREVQENTHPVLPEYYNHSTLGGIPCLYIASDHVSTKTTESYNRKYTNRAMAADREKDLEPVENVIVSGSHELCRCLRLSQPQLRRFSPPPLPGRQSDGFKRVRNLKHSTWSGVTCSSRL